MRRIVPVVAIALASALLLSGCGSAKSSSGSTPKATSTASPSATAPAAVSLGCDVKPGAASAAVKITGAEGATPTVNVPKALKASGEQRTVITAGTGDKPVAGTTLLVGFAAYDSTSGKQISAPFGWGSTEGDFTVQLGSTSLIPGLTHAFGCVPVGSRVAYAATASTAFGGASTVTQNFTDGSVKATDTVVFVGDVLGTVPNKADGAAQPAKPGFPTVTLAADGTPTLTIPKTLTPPKTTTIEVLKKGTGTTVKSGDTVTVQYQGTEWKSGQIFDESWGTGHGGAFPSTPTSFQTTQVVPGFSKALVGQTVGSQVLVEIPPADGYAASPPTGQTIITATSTLVFVIDILYTAATPAQ